MLPDVPPLFWLGGSGGGGGLAAGCGGRPETLGLPCAPDGGGGEAQNILSLSASEMQVQNLNGLKTSPSAQRLEHWSLATF